MGWSDSELAAIVADGVQDGWIVNIGIGMPTLIIPLLHGRDVLLHSENGIIGMGPAPAPGHEEVDVVDAAKQYATVIPGGSIVDSVGSFTLVRGGRLSLAIVGAYQVSFEGDLANWKLPGRRVAGVGGAADLAVGARQLWAMTKFFGPRGEPKLVPKCTYPLTARGVVFRVYTDQGIFECGRPARLIRPAPGADPKWLETQLRDEPVGASGSSAVPR